MHGTTFGPFFVPGLHRVVGRQPHVELTGICKIEQKSNFQPYLISERTYLLPKVADGFERFLSSVLANDAWDHIRALFRTGVASGPRAAASCRNL